MPYDARAIANEVLKLSGEREVSQMWLQKMVYLVHAWNLAVNGEALVSDRVEAWDGGPVFRKIWNHFHEYGRNAEGGLLGKPDGTPYEANLSDNEKSVIKHVWDRYDGYNDLDLSRVTHQKGTPWYNAYFGRGQNSALSNTDTRNHFIELAVAGRTLL